MGCYCLFVHVDSTVQCVPVCRAIYGIVLDSKYISKLKDQHWNETAKYLEIRSTESRRQVVRQLWLIVPGDHSEVKSEDPAVQFTDLGASCAPDEAVRFRLIASPSEIDGNADAGNPGPDPFVQFAKGTMNFLRREFGAETVKG